MKEKLLVDKLIALNYTIASAESCTGGMFASTIVNVENASKVIKSSVVTYSNEAKIKYCNVKQETIDKYGVVSVEVAKEMATGIKLECNSNIAVSFTGFAGPVGDNKAPAGTVCIGIVINDNIYLYNKQFDGDRFAIRRQSVEFVIEELLKLLQAKIITVTGVSGCGKSTLSNLLCNKLNMKYISIDNIVAEMYNNIEMQNKIIEVFGDIVLNENKKLDKKLVSNLVLNDKNAWDKLNLITWDYIEKNVDKLINECNFNAVIDYLFIPITKYMKQANINILVKPKDLNIRSEKVCQRDNILIEKILRRDEFSPNFDEYNFDYIIENDYTDNFINECNQLAEELRGRL